MSFGDFGGVDWAWAIGEKVISMSEKITVFSI